MLNLRFLVLAALTALALPSAAEPLTAAGRLSTLRGFQIGVPCHKLETPYARLREEGFDVPPASFTCHHQAGSFRTDYLLRQVDGRHELIELSFTPESILWKTKVSLTWEGRSPVSEQKPSPSQVEASLKALFGQPYARAGDGALIKNQPAGEHSVALVWAQSPPEGDSGPLEADKLLWSHWTSGLTGVVSTANVIWTDKSNRQSLVIEQMNRDLLPYALAGQSNAAARRDAERAKQDASHLRGL